MTGSIISDQSDVSGKKMLLMQTYAQQTLQSLLIH